MQRSDLQPFIIYPDALARRSFWVDITSKKRKIDMILCIIIDNKEIQIASKLTIQTKWHILISFVEQILIKQLKRYIYNIQYCTISRFIINRRKTINLNTQYKFDGRVKSILRNQQLKIFIIKLYGVIILNLISQQIQDKIEMLLPTAQAAQANPQKLMDTKEMSTGIVYIEYCSKCDSHLFTVRHDEHKYLMHFQNIKNFLSEQGIVTKKRPVPRELFRQSPYCPPNVYYKSNGEVVYYPQIGSFEVFYGTTKIFSKLQSSKWPSADHLLVLIKQKQNESGQLQQNKIRFTQPVKKEQSSVRQEVSNTLEQQIFKVGHRMRITSYQNVIGRYSLDRRNLFNKKQSKNFKPSRKVNSSHERPADLQKNQIQIVRMYSPVVKKHVHPWQLGNKLELDGIPTAQGKARVLKANIYLEPIFPKTKVNLENYQKHRLILSQRIHHDRLTYQASKHKEIAIANQPFEKKYKAKFNNLTTALHNIRQSTQEHEPKGKIINQDQNQLQQEKQVNNSTAKNKKPSLDLSHQKQQNEDQKYYNDNKDQQQQKLNKSQTKSITNNEAKQATKRQQIALLNIVQIKKDNNQQDSKVKQKQTIQNNFGKTQNNNLLQSNQQQNLSLQKGDKEVHKQTKTQLAQADGVNQITKGAEPQVVEKEVSQQNQQEYAQAFENQQQSKLQAPIQQPEKKEAKQQPHLQQQQNNKEKQTQKQQLIDLNNKKTQNKQDQYQNDFDQNQIQAEGQIQNQKPQKLNNQQQIPQSKQKNNEIYTKEQFDNYEQQKVEEKNNVQQINIK